ncbi:MAG: hypothetical protein ACHRHE_24170 [Tepidisphaerales bacterium]
MQQLWPETVQALKDLPRLGDSVFYTSRRSYTTFSVLAKFRAYREAAKVGDQVTFSGIRDASFTIACQSVSLDQAKALAGHRLPGVTSFYLRRNVRYVASACEAIRRAFLKGRR